MGQAARKRRNSFSHAETQEIAALIEKLRRFKDSRAAGARSIRKRLRDEFGFYITDYQRSREGFTIADLRAAIASGRIKVFT